MSAKISKQTLYLEIVHKEEAFIALIGHCNALSFIDFSRLAATAKSLLY